MCRASEPVTNLLALAMLLSLVFFVMYVIYQKHTSTIRTAKKKSDEQPVKLPVMIYFTSTAVARNRCFHTSEKCNGLRRASSVCSATACKLCVDQSTSASSSLDQFDCREYTPCILMQAWDKSSA